MIPFTHLWPSASSIWQLFSGSWCEIHCVLDFHPYLAVLLSDSKRPIHFHPIHRSFPRRYPKLPEMGSLKSGLNRSPSGACYTVILLYCYSKVLEYVCVNLFILRLAPEKARWHLCIYIYMFVLCNLKNVFSKDPVLPYIYIVFNCIYICRDSHSCFWIINFRDFKMNFQSYASLFPVLRPVCATLREEKSQRPLHHPTGSFASRHFP